MPDTTSRTPSAPDNPPDATLVFHEQADGRKAARLPGGKVVLVDYTQLDRVRDGEAWYVRLRHHETFAIAEPVERVTAATLESTGGTLRTPLADALNRARLVEARRSPTPPAAAPAPPASPAEPVTIGTPAPSSTPPAPPEPPALAPPPTAGAIDIGRLIRATDRVALFIDGANTDYAARTAGYFVDFRKVRDFFLAGASVYAAFYYVADFTASDPLQQRFFDFLSHAGYIVRRRPVKLIHDTETGERIIKGNLDTEMVLDMMNTLDNYDVAFLFSGDSDFERAVDLLRSRGKRLFVVSARSHISRELAYVADKPIVYLEDHRAELARTDRAPGA
ncbi:MAG: NYN domain-containing protein [Acidobacteriota bacterium]